MITGKFKPSTGRFGSSSKEVKQKLLEDADTKNTKKSTKSAIATLNAFIAKKGLQKLENTPDLELPSLLEDFYVAACTKKNELYNTQTLKTIRSSLNRHFKIHRKIDIIEDREFQGANQIFKSVQVTAKKSGKGVRRSTPVISDEDMKRLAGYFCIDHTTSPNPSVLQRNVLFNIMYYLCRRGQENLYSMTKNWFDVITEPSGDTYVMQVMDEVDKNHSEEDTQLTNQGQMYAVPGEIGNFYVS